MRPENVCSVRPRAGIYIVSAGIGRFIRRCGVKAQGRSMFKVQGSTFQLGTGQPTKKGGIEMKLTLESASLIVDRALAKAREAKFRPMCVAVLDDGGHVKALKREDGASILRPNIAIGKAWGAVGMGESSRQLSERLKERPAFLGALSDMSGGKVVPVARSEE